MIKESDYWLFCTKATLLVAAVCAFFNADIAAWVGIVLSMYYRFKFKKWLIIEEKTKELMEHFEEIEKLMKEKSVENDEDNE